MDGVDVMLQVKDNQPTLRTRCVALTATKKPWRTYTQKDNAHGRKETRKTSLFVVRGFDLGNDWNVLHAVIQVERTVVHYSHKEKRTVISNETAYYVTTADDLSVKECARAIRAHWRIENSNHYVRDVTLGEDASRIRKKPENVARLRSFALNLLRVNGEDNVSQALYRNATNPHRMCGYKGIC